jgi:hypothetical protein
VVVNEFTNRCSRVNSANLFSRKRKEVKFLKQCVLYNTGPWIKPGECMTSYTMHHYQNLPDSLCVSTKSVSDL